MYNFNDEQHTRVVHAPRLASGQSHIKETGLGILLNTCSPSEHKDSNVSGPGPKEPHEAPLCPLDGGGRIAIGANLAGDSDPELWYGDGFGEERGVVLA